MERDYKTICDIAPEFALKAKLEEFMRIRCLVNSRLFGIKIDGVYQDAIIPIAGMPII